MASAFYHAGFSVIDINTYDLLNKIDNFDNLDGIVFVGGFTFSDVYEMPVYLRSFYYKKLVDAKEKEKEQLEKSQKQQKSVQRPNIQKPPAGTKFRR